MEFQRFGVVILLDVLFKKEHHFIVLLFHSDLFFDYYYK